MLFSTVCRWREEPTCLPLFLTSQVKLQMCLVAAQRALLSLRSLNAVAVWLQRASPGSCRKKSPWLHCARRGVMYRYRIDNNTNQYKYVDDARCVVLKVRICGTTSFGGFNGALPSASSGDVALFAKRIIAEVRELRHPKASTGFQLLCHAKTYDEMMT